MQIGALNRLTFRCMQKSSSVVGVPTLAVATKSQVLLKIPFEGSPIRTCVTSKLNAAKCVNCYWQICILLLLQTCTNKIFRSCAHCTGTNDKLFLLFHEIQCHYEKGNQIINLKSMWSDLARGKSRRNPKCQSREIHLCQYRQILLIGNCLLIIH